MTIEQPPTEQPPGVQPDLASARSAAPAHPDTLKALESADLADLVNTVRVHALRITELEQEINAHSDLFDDVEELATDTSSPTSSYRREHQAHGRPAAGSDTVGDARRDPDATDDDSAAAVRDQRGAPDADSLAAGLIDIDPLRAWVQDNIAQLIERKVRGRVDAGPHWCPQWWHHPEAILRFEALHRAWTTLITDDGLGLITYLTHLDHTLAALMADAGPFHAGSCKHDRHNTVAVLGDQRSFGPSPAPHNTETDRGAQTHNRRRISP